MMTIERAGAGVACGVSDYEPQKIKRVVSAMLEDTRYRAGAGKIAEIFRSYDACQQFRNFVQKLVG
jgi:UDP:flavonoid glycosyltransferase YjiC (YdhE family)